MPNCIKFLMYLLLQLQWNVLISYEKAANNESLQENEKFATAIVKRYGHIRHIV